MANKKIIVFKNVIYIHFPLKNEDIAIKRQQLLFKISKKKKYFINHKKTRYYVILVSWDIGT